MPNIKIFVDDTQLDAISERLTAGLPGLREMICRDLEVSRSACQFAIIGVKGMPEQPTINFELGYIRRPDRTPELCLATAQRIRERMLEITGLPAAIRMSPIEAVGYVTLK